MRRVFSVMHCHIYLFYVHTLLSLSGNSGRLTRVRLQQPQEQRYPVLTQAGFEPPVFGSRLSPTLYQLSHPVTLSRASTRDPKNRGLNTRPELTKNVFFASQKCCADSLSVCQSPVCIRTHENEHVRLLRPYAQHTPLKDPVV